MMCIDALCVCVCLQECGHSDSGRVSGVGHSGQTANLAVHPPATDLRRTRALPEQAVTLPGFQEQW